MTAPCTSVSGSQAEQHSITDTESVHHTHFRSFSASERWAHNYTAQTPPATKTVKIPLPQTAGEKKNPPSVQE